MIILSDFPISILHSLLPLWHVLAFPSCHCSLASHDTNVTALFVFQCVPHSMPLFYCYVFTCGQHCVIIMPPWTFLHYLLGHMQGFFWGVNLRVEFLGPGASLFFHITRYRTVVSKASEPMTLPRRHILSLLRHDWFGAVVNKFSDLKLHPFALNSILVSSFNAIDPQSFPQSPVLPFSFLTLKFPSQNWGRGSAGKDTACSMGSHAHYFFRKHLLCHFPPDICRKGGLC